MDQTQVKEPAELFLADLKAQTTDLHKALEALPISAMLMSQSATLKSYTFYLTAMKEVVAFWESVVFPEAASVFPDIEARRKLAAINKDLASLKNLVPVRSLSPFPALNELTVARAAGFMYVMEGSTLGGKVILRHLESIGLLDGRNHGSFFEGYRDSTGPYWRSCLLRISSFAIGTNSSAEVIEGAKQAFQMIHDYFNSFRIDED